MEQNSSDHMEWYLEAEMMHRVPVWSKLTSSAQSAIIKDMTHRMMANQSLWPSAGAFVANYAITVEDFVLPAWGTQWEIWGSLLNILNHG